MFPAKVGVPVETWSGPGFPGIPAQTGVSARNWEFLPESGPEPQLSGFRPKLGNSWSGPGFPGIPAQTGVSARNWEFLPRPGFPDPPRNGVSGPPRNGVSGPPRKGGVSALLIKGRLTCKTAKLDSTSLHVKEKNGTFFVFSGNCVAGNWPKTRNFPIPSRLSGRKGSGNPETSPETGFPDPETGNSWPVSGSETRFRASFRPKLAIPGLVSGFRTPSGGVSDPETGNSWLVSGRKPPSGGVSDPFRRGFRPRNWQFLASFGVSGPLPEGFPTPKLAIPG